MTTNTMAEIDGARLRAWRERKGWSLAYMANVFGVTKTTLHRWEQGHHRISHPKLLSMAIELIESRGHAQCAHCGRVVSRFQPDRCFQCDHAIVCGPCWDDDTYHSKSSPRSNSFR